MTVDEHDQQVSSGDDFGGARCCERNAAEVLPCLQPEEVHPASTVRVFGSQGFFKDRLSRFGRSLERLSEPDRSYPSYGGAALHDVAKSRAAAVGSSPCSSFVGHHS